MARMKKQSVEQSLSSAYNAVNLLQPSSMTETEDHLHHSQQLEQQQQQQQQSTRSGLHKSWTSISQESLGDGEDEDGGYTTTLTVGDNGSLHSHFSDSSYLTMLTANINTSLSSGYHGPASLMGDPHPASSPSSCSDNDEQEEEEEDDEEAIHQQYHNHQMMLSNCDGTTSGMFYLEWLEMRSKEE
jgi:hypothetical protein